MRPAFLLLAILFTLSAGAQKHGNIWYFGNGAGLDFSGGAPAAFTDGQTGTDTVWADLQEGTASICDSAGDLLFYTGGQTIWNRHHQRMPNGSGLMGCGSSTQSSIIIPKPGGDSLFYIFMSDGFRKYYPQQTYGPAWGYRYSVVDMCLDSGRGDVVQAGKIFFSPTLPPKSCAPARSPPAKDTGLQGTGCSATVSTPGISLPPASRIP